jgi:hypothetical protein
MKKISILKQLNIVAIVIASLLMSCTDKFAEINTNRNAIATVGSAELPFLFSKAEATAMPNIWNYQVAQNLFADQYAQYFSNTTTYFPSDRYNIRMDWVGAAFNPFYSEMAPQLESIFAASKPDSPESALANILWVIGFHRVTDYWGPIPYSKAGKPGASVAYDAQDKVYDDFFKRLASATSALKAQIAKDATVKTYGAYDLIYGGDLVKWRKLANTLRLRLAIRISKVDPARAKTEAEAAVADGVMTSETDDATLEKSTNGNDTNGLSQMSDWNEFRMSATMESVLKGYKDPRMKVYWLPNGATGDNPKGTGEYDGLRNGLTVAQLGEKANQATNNAKVGAKWSSPSFAGDPGYLSTRQNIMCGAEAYFLRAEGATLGWSMAGTAKELYDKGIETSMKQWGISDAAAIAEYINSDATPVAPDDFMKSPAASTAPIKFSSDPKVQKEQIAIQKWVALFPDGNEAWADQRRGRYFPGYPVVSSENPDITDPKTQYIRRINFLLSEKQNNKAGVDTGIPLLGPGGDKITTPLWWDKN